MDDMTVDPLTSSAERTLRLVELLLSEPDGLTPQEILAVLGTSRSSLFNLLRRLKTLGYIDQNERRGRYHSGPRLQAWRSAPTDSMQTLLSAFYQEASRQSWAETLLLCVPAPEGILILGQVESSQGVRSVYTIGEVSNALNAVGSVLQSTPGSDVKANGYALTQPPQLFELALPICPDGNLPQAALLFSAPAYRWTQESLVQACLPELRAMAARLSYRMGATQYTPYHSALKTELDPESRLGPEELRDFLEGPWTARLACIRPDGKPHVIPVWQSWDGVHFTVIAWQGSQWAEYLLQNPSVSLTIDEPWPPLRRVAARGTAFPLTEHASLAKIDALVQRFAHRYLGASANTLKAENVLRVFQIEPDYLRGWQGLPGSVSLPGQQSR
ncbi:MAG: pyridoxamine 5'-phosphate oxidase family protein [Bellilinea sp.]